ncbi:hypothetical protein C922_05715 [Plasmodium inui San Antonio 1]|uniref:Uncharacterized protein n=1 Tax=Plasmodium inui San Antonio 1 TaxID=1237626 RepID=W6ZSK8_9APIC|nr:hypothetical protein C922_05715 [Plasmodium inui San Antonio 1]EUD63902.1 hypothetical protein C922_05715 [Plasmodium inui San Antonio 1]
MGSIGEKEQKAGGPNSNEGASEQFLRRSKEEVLGSEVSISLYLVRAPVIFIRRHPNNPPKVKELKAQKKEQVWTPKEKQPEYCYDLSFKSHRSTRGVRGVSSWLNRWSDLVRNYMELKDGVDMKKFKSENNEGPLEWEDLLHSIVSRCINSAKGRSMNTEEDQYLGEADWDLWRGFVSQNAIIRCQDSAECQRMLFLVGCIMYWLWGRDIRIVNTDSGAYKKCEQLKLNLLKVSQQPRRWKWVSEKITLGPQELCQANTNFEDCRMYVLSIVLAVANQMREICPSCPMTGLDEIFNEQMFQLAPEGIYCPTKDPSQRLCLRSVAEGANGYVKVGQISSEPQVQEGETGGSKTSAQQKDIQKAASLNQGTGAGSVQNEAAIEEQVKTGPSGDYDAPGGHPSAHKANNLQKNDKDAPTGLPTPPSLVSQSNGSRRRQNSQTVGLQAKLGTDKGQIGEALGTEGVRSETNTMLQQQPTETSTPFQDTQGELEQTSSLGGTIGGTVAVGLSLIASAYGLYRIYLKPSRRRRKVPVEFPAAQVSYRKI